jgi:hypothetical protein
VQHITIKMVQGLDAIWTCCCVKAMSRQSTTFVCNISSGWFGARLLCKAPHLSAAPPGHTRVVEPCRLRAAVWL